MNQREQEPLESRAACFFKLLFIITVISLKLTAEHTAEVTITFSRGPVPKMLWCENVADFLVWASQSCKQNAWHWAVWHCHHIKRKILQQPWGRLKDWVKVLGKKEGPVSECCYVKLMPF